MTGGACFVSRSHIKSHANKELKSDRLTYEDIINCILTGEIIEQQFDSARREEKYVLYGDALAGTEMAVVAKLGHDQTTVIITVYRLRITDYDF